jgi:hypothetical protein
VSETLDNIVPEERVPLESLDESGFWVPQNSAGHRGCYLTQSCEISSLMRCPKEHKSICRCPYVLVVVVELGMNKSLLAI